ncbi:type II toxin-antitoxin system HicB family antitoxin [Candidatus Peregrinibacteria bacterium]|nr:MAG: type II toxin-antitoxin system HicB family antitoxin [Candidatus Peregrinibacteria bacterium]
MQSSILNYLVFFKEEPEGGFTVLVPSLQGCVSYGENLEEAKRMAEEAILLYIEDLIESGEEVPSDEKAFSLSIKITKPAKRKEQYA